MANTARAMHNDQTETWSGPYDRFYREMGVAWPDTPGRMVRRAIKILKPGTALDAGCGDGKNAVFLAGLGWRVTAFDISAEALRSFALRTAGLAERTSAPIHVYQADAAIAEHAPETYDLVVAYGLYHCLSDNQMRRAHTSLARALKIGGLFAFAALDDSVPIPTGHGTASLTLRPRPRLVELFSNWPLEASEQGTINEQHLPVIGEHKHSVTWILARKPQP
jgi:SAM-dependent methyltransferase